MAGYVLEFRIKEFREEIEILELFDTTWKFDHFSCENLFPE